MQEAAASGAAVICTTACGGASRLVLDGYNGRVVAPDDAEQLAKAMRWIANRTTRERVEISRRAVELARQYTPSRWAEHLVDRCRELLPGAITR
jgi:glycosyltransferase involved in cell wall biosynthesis